MNLHEYAGYDATGLAELVRNGEVSPGALAKTASRAIQELNPQLNAVVEVWDDRITALDDRTLAAGPFHGVPFLLKDLGPRIAGRKQNSGSRLTAGYVADYTHFFSQKMMDAGLNIIGRTTCPEFGVTGTTESALTGATRNPWNLNHIAGGSSGGSAAAVAAGIVPMAHANDGGGSTRIPAAICGNIGLKHSRGRISYAPDGCDLSFPLFSEGVNARSVRDVAGFLDAVRGPAPGEPIMFPEPRRPFAEEAKHAPPPLRVGLCVEPWGVAAPTAEVRKDLERVARICESLGHHVEYCTPAIDYQLYFQTFKQIWCIDIAAMLEAESAAMRRELGPETLEPVTLKIYQQGKLATVLERLSVNGQINLLTRQLGLVFESFDVLLTPVLAQPTPLIGSALALADEQVSLDDWFANLIATIPYTPLNNLSGTPAISLPLCADVSGMPLGAHFMARVGREDLLINLAAQLESSAPWWGNVPPLHISRIAPRETSSRIANSV